MKILLIGDADTNGKIPTYSRIFREFGHKTDIIDVEEYYSLSFPNRVLNWVLRPHRYYGVKRLNDEVKKRIFSYEPDFVLFFKPNYITPQTASTIKENGIITFSLSGDPVFFLRNISRSFLRAIPFYDCFFTANPLEVDELLKLGAHKAIFLPPAVDTELMYPVSPSVEDKKHLGADVVFIGTYAWGEKREKYLEKLCRKGYDIKVYGNLWNRCLRCRSLRKNKCLMYKAYYWEDFSKVVNSGKIVINFLREQDRDVLDSRTYELPACKAFMLHERTNEAMNIFKEGKEAEFFGSFKEFVEKIDYYLTRPDERKKIAEAGYKRVMKLDCSFKARANTILDVYRHIKQNVQIKKGR